jgi:hypothetical protein
LRAKCSWRLRNNTGSIWHIPEVGEATSFTVHPTRPSKGGFFIGRFPDVIFCLEPAGRNARRGSCASGLDSADCFCAGQCIARAWRTAKSEPVAEQMLKVSVFKRLEFEAYMATLERCLPAAPARCKGRLSGIWIDSPIHLFLFCSQWSSALRQQRNWMTAASRSGSGLRFRKLDCPAFLRCTTGFVTTPQMTTLFIP